MQGLQRPCLILATCHLILVFGYRVNPLLRDYWDCSLNFCLFYQTQLVCIMYRVQLPHIEAVRQYRRNMITNRYCYYIHLANAFIQS